jgi:DNA-binding transcriptional LysR family regulator
MAQDRYKHSRLQQLRGFCHVVQTGSFSKAAERMFLSQPTISLQVQALEREFDSKLIERKGPKIKLTDEGKILYEMSLPLVDGIDKLDESFIHRKEFIDSGTLDIAAGESTILYILPKFIAKFSREYPKVEIKLHNVTGRDGLAMLREGEIDLVVGSMIDVPQDIDYRPTFTYDPVLIAHRGHPLSVKKKVTMKDISKYALILPPKHLSTWRVVDFVFQQHNLHYHVAMEAGGWEVIKKYVSLGMGISIVTSICLEDDDDHLEKIPLSQYFPKRSYGLVLKKGKVLSPLAKKFIELMEQQSNES